MTIQRKSFAARRQNRNRISTICCLLLLCTSGILAYCYHRERSLVLKIQNERDALKKEYADLKLRADVFKTSVQDVFQVFVEMLEHLKQLNPIIEEQQSLVISLIELQFTQMEKYRAALMRHDVKNADSILSSVTPDISRLSGKMNDIDNATKRSNEEIKKINEVVVFFSKKINEFSAMLEVLQKTSQP